MGKTKVGLLFGGRSGEHEVSIISAQAIASALNQDSNATKYEVIPVTLINKELGMSLMFRIKF